MKPPGVLKTLVGVVSEVRTANNLESSCKLLLLLSQATEMTIFDIL